MKKHTFLLFLLLISFSQLNAQVNNLQYNWAQNISRSYAGSFSVTNDRQGNCIVAGYFSATADFGPAVPAGSLTSAGGMDAYIAKYTTNGTFLWAIKMGGAGDDLAMAVTTDQLGNVFVAGEFTGTVDFDPSPGTANLTGGSITNTGLFLAEYDSSGALVWAKQISSNHTLDVYEGKNLWLDSHKNIVLGGYLIGTVNFDPTGAAVPVSTINSYRDAFLAKYDSLGNYIWAKSFGSGGDDNVTSIAVDNNDNIFCSGFFRDTVDFDLSAGVSTMISAPYGSAFLAKYDAAGNYLWAGSMNSSAFLSRLATDSAGNVYMTGVYSGLTDFDLSAATATLNGTSSNAFLAKYTASGNYLWAVCAGDHMVIPRGIELDHKGNPCIVGDFSDTADFDPSPSLAELIPVVYANPDVFIARYTSAGHFISVDAIEGSGFEYGTCISIDPDDHVFISGPFTDVCDFDPSAAVASQTSVSLSNMNLYLAKYSQPLVGISEQEEHVFPDVYPNPASSFISIAIKAEGSNRIRKTVLYDLQGKRLSEQQLNDTRARVELSGLAEGVYLLAVQTDKGITYTKIIRQ
ncbi:MAG: hypothetical protein JWO44_40 [Bacteroidetes bacterium]|nr:hypothetical protein [Bacteroidota bacterium]